MARLLIERGIQPVPINPCCGKPSKGPSGAFGTNWQHRRFTKDDIPNLHAHFPPDYNIGFMPGAPSGHVLDVDLDCAEARTIAPTYLDVSTGMKWGRASAPLTHLAYRGTYSLPEPEVYHRPGTRKALVELRSMKGGPDAKGFQTVLPPSIHPETGERYEWCPGGDGEPLQVDTDWLRGQVALIAAASMLARVFPKEGSRHEFALALGGGILRCDSSDVDEVRKFVYEVCRAGGSADPGKRADTVYFTTDKIARGEEVVGFTRLAEIVGADGPAVVKKLREWLKLQDPIFASAEAFRAQYERIKRGGKASASPPPPDPQTTEGEAPAASQPMPPPQTVGVPTGSTTTLPVAVVVPRNGAGEETGEEGETAEEQEAQREYREKAKRTKEGNLIACGYNAYVVLTTATRGCFRWDDVAKRIQASDPFEGIGQDHLPTKVANWLMEHFDLHVSRDEVAAQIGHIADENKFDPIRDYLRSLRWDGVSRISAGRGWLHAYANARLVDGNDFVEFAGRKWLLSAVARALKPGCKADLVLILEGAQGRRKSTFFDVLGGPWYVDVNTQVGDKDSKMITAGFWIGELPDLAPIQGRDQNAVKAFFTLREDKFRRPYGRAVETALRRIVFGGTTNDVKYLNDDTGNRRYICISIECPVDIKTLKQDRDQIFAEAVVLYDKHVAEHGDDNLDCCCWWFTPEEAVIAEIEASKRSMDDGYAEMISKWWFATKPEDRPPNVTTLEIAQRALLQPNDKISRRLQTQIGTILTKMKWQHQHGTLKRLGGQLTWYYTPPHAWSEAPLIEDENQAKRAGIGVVRYLPVKR